MAITPNERLAVAVHQEHVVKIVDGPGHLNGAKTAVITGVGLPGHLSKVQVRFRAWTLFC
jgi:hypothetical protein